MDFTEKQQCCACSACVYICPRNAVELKRDSAGFLFANIDETKCVSCGKCMKVCPVAKNPVTDLKKRRALAAVSLDETAKNSASGGIFAILAKRFIEQGGAVFGTEMGADFRVKVVGVTQTSELFRLQGSKYVQADVSEAFAEIEHFLKEGRPVLFGGTPCQCAAVRNVFGDAAGLYLVDIICHGVPNQEMFLASVANLQKKRKKEITALRFRDKKYGQRVIGTLTLAGGRQKKLPAYRYDYYSLFLKNDILAESCFSCKYAQGARVGDLTIGDYWGVHRELPSFFESCSKKGNPAISAIYVNTSAGDSLLELAQKDLLVTETDSAPIEKRNPNLQRPTERGADYEVCLKIYENEGWEGLSSYYFKKNRKGNFKKALFAAIPTPILNFLKKRG